MQQDKPANRPKIFEELEKIAQILPTPIYWEDVNSVIIGANEQALKASGALVPEAYIGKTLHELYPHEMADNIKRHNEEVMRLETTLSQEEVIEDITTGKIKYFTAIKTPLRDDDGKVIGIVGTSLDITAEKEAERLELENELQKKLLLEHEKFTKMADQVAHDIRSPLASLLMIVKACTKIPEKERIALREAAINIGDIANNLLNQYKPKDTTGPLSSSEERQPILCSTVLLQLLTDTKYRYQDSPIKFDHEFSQEGNFAFIKIEPLSFKRMVSNIINNAVESITNNDGKVIVKLNADNEWVKVTIQDNGKGISPELINKIMNNISVTEGKRQGHGIGLTQVRETLQRNQGELKIDSKLGSGTKVILTFPRITAPSWIAEEIKLNDDDLVIILDDDTSIHSAWNAHFEPILKKMPSIQIKHFKLGEDALNFIYSLSPAQTEKVFLLTDYELLNQELNGLDVVDRSKIKRSVLVTSHYANKFVLNHAALAGAKILPKLLASEIPITFNKPAKHKEEFLKKADLVLIDDNKIFAESLMMYLDEINIHYYQNPHSFLQKLDHYSKETKIYLDNDFNVSDMNGPLLAEKLYHAGYTRLYIVSGKSFLKDELPAYITIIDKNDIETIKQIAISP
ncbi:MAG: hypothetical protein K0Q57_498 [Gammaproteobacteria bacterium]|nr:hypothetical protein [Gammaproteobacteria bacterium]